MRISVVGTGHVGLTTAACLAHIGHEVLGVDDDSGKIERIAAGEAPFFEPGLAEMVAEQLATGRLSVSADVAEAARGREVVFVCVGTPTKPSGEPDLEQVRTVALTLAGALDGYSVVTEKSTVPVGTADAIRQVIRDSVATGLDFDVASNPEFSQEGRAIADTLEPSRIVVGTSSERAEATLRRVYEPIVAKTGCPFVATNIATAEIVKHASNSFLAMKVSFINQVADMCERTDADVGTVAAAMGMDPRIGSAFLRAGIGYGGSCFPKDVQAFRHTAEQLGVDFGLLSEVERINSARTERFVDKISSTLGALDGRRIALWGLTFKPDTDDLRGSPALAVARLLTSVGASVRAFDPVAMEAARPLLPEAEFADDPLDAARGADCLAICTEWPAFAEVDLNELREVMAQPVIVDGRNLLDAEDAAAAGFRYASIGRSSQR